MAGTHSRWACPPPPTAAPHSSPRHTRTPLCALGSTSPTTAKGLRTKPSQPRTRPARVELVEQVRAYDPAGNRDNELLSRNVYTWRYIPALPWLLIILGAIIIITGIVIAVLYVKHKRRKAVLERYALKRRQRKLKVPCGGGGGASCHGCVLGVGGAACRPRHRT